MKGKYRSLIVNRILVTGVLVLLQAAWIIFQMEKLAGYSEWISAGFNLLSILVVLYVIGKDDNSAYRIGWIILVMAFPLLGGMIYVVYGDKKPSRKMRLKLETQHRMYRNLIADEGSSQEEKERKYGRAAGTFHYIQRVSDYPAYENTSVSYFPCGEKLFAAMLREMETAEHFIFLEYFIVAQGSMWDQTLDVLKRKAAQGVDVRLIYDDMGCLALLPAGYHAALEKQGIKCMAFNPVIPFVSLVMNHRDHRKILVVDGHTAFTGGINISDEYINERSRFGYWKDTGICLKGEAVWNFTVMFLEMWNAFRREDADIRKFRPEVWHPEPFAGKGLVCPYGDSPLDREPLAENVYLDIINQAKRYVYIFTPYLILDDIMRESLCNAAKRGVDVRIVTPGIPDKKMVFRLTRSNYAALLEAGIRIFEFAPGFLHAKSYICDDEFGVVGSVNMDYRSLYLHFECATLLYRTEGLEDLKRDALDTIRQSREITSKDCRKGFWGGLLDDVLRVFAPLC